MRGARHALGGPRPAGVHDRQRRADARGRAPERGWRSASPPGSEADGRLWWLARAVQPTESGLCELCPRRATHRGDGSASGPRVAHPDQQQVWGAQHHRRRSGHLGVAEQHRRARARRLGAPAHLALDPRVGVPLPQGGRQGHVSQVAGAQCRSDRHIELRLERIVRCRGVRAAWFVRPQGGVRAAGAALVAADRPAGRRRVLRVAARPRPRQRRPVAHPERAILGRLTT
mmetsp:Transcript_92043/g.281714  ORF Transcript_92043/g.281714 Transcript_92043/m.281714 type:complete len:230 (+) Transcript_92043:99-788(+)